MWVTSLGAVNGPLVHTRFAAQGQSMPCDRRPLRGRTFQYRHVVSGGHWTGQRHCDDRLISLSLYSVYISYR